MERDVILHGDALATLRTLPDACVQTCVTSPPYWGLRDYGVSGQLGHEATPAEYVERMVEVMSEVRRVLRDDGTLWLNLGDSYAGSWGACSYEDGSNALRRYSAVGAPGRKGPRPVTSRVSGDLKPKDLVGIPWMVAFALRADGWYLRSDIVWHKLNCMPESVTDRPTRSHEYIFLLSKSRRYYYDAATIREPAAASTLVRLAQPTFDRQQGGPKDPKSGNRSARRALENLHARADKQRGHSRKHAGFNDRWDAMSKDAQQALGANKRDVWTVGTRPFPGAHFATFPPALIEPCILAGSRPRDVVLDPFMGAGTTAVVARRHSRHYLGIELNPAYIELAEKRIDRETQPVLWTA